MGKFDTFESYADFEKTISKLGELSTSISNTLERTKEVYSEQRNAWHSQTANREKDKMVEYTDNSKKIATYLTEISEAAIKYEEAMKKTDEV